METRVIYELMDQYVVGPSKNVIHGIIDRGFTSFNFDKAKVILKLANESTYGTSNPMVLGVYRRIVPIQSGREAERILERIRSGGVDNIMANNFAQYFSLDEISPELVQVGYPSQLDPSSLKGLKKEENRIVISPVDALMHDNPELAAYQEAARNYYSLLNLSDPNIRVYEVEMKTPFLNAARRVLETNGLEKSINDQLPEFLTGLN